MNLNNVPILNRSDRSVWSFCLDKSKIEFMKIEQVKKLVESGMSIQRIANDLNLSREDVKRVIENENLSLKKEKFSEDKIPYICELYQSGISAKILGIKYSIDKRRIQKWVGSQGLLRNKNDSHRVTNFNQHIFDNIDTPTKAYWLGFFLC